MARRKKEIILDEELSKLNKEAEKYENKLKEINERKKEIETLIEQKRKDDLYQAVLKSGKSMDEVFSWINESVQKEEQEKNEGETSSFNM